MTKGRVKLQYHLQRVWLLIVSCTANRAYEHIAGLRLTPLLGQVIFQGLNLPLVIMGDLQPSAAVLLSSPASLCVYIYVCVWGHCTIPLPSLLYILVTPPSFRWHLYSSFYVCVCDVDSSCDNSETKVIFKETVMQRGCETAPA